MKRTPGAWLLLGAWVAALAAIGAYLQRDLVVGSDLRLFLPRPATPAQELVLDGLGEGPASRLLVIALGGAPAEQLAAASRDLAAALREEALFTFAANGEASPESLPQELLPYRYLLSPLLDGGHLDREYLERELAQRARDLASPAGLLIEPWLARDPTLALFDLLQRWQPLQEPQRQFDVWFDAAGEQALLVAETRAAAFDAAGQRAALGRLEDAFAAAAAAPVRMTVSGAGVFSTLMEARTRSEAQVLGLTASAGMILLLLLGYRSIGSVVLSALPLLTAGVVGLAAVIAMFDGVHGITLAFGFTLMGVAQDYPLHLLSHNRAGRAPLETARHLWRPLATGVASTCIAYFTFAFSGVLGLAQLACLTVAGLAAAALTTRFLLPRLMTAPRAQPRDSAVLGRVWSCIRGLPRPRLIAPGLIVLGVAGIVLSPAPLWENDLAGLTPVPPHLLETDRLLRAQLGTADIRYLLAVPAASAEAALETLEALDPGLAGLVAAGAIQGYDHAARYLPPAASQARRQAALPAPQALRADLRALESSLPFRPGAFEPFVTDIDRARSLPPLTPERLRALGLARPVDALLRPGFGALVTLSGVRDAGAVQDLAASTGSGAQLIDVRAASAALVAHQRARILLSLAVAAVLLAGVVALSLREAGRVYRVLAPLAVTTLLVAAVLQMAGVSLTLFHLISLILVAGLGLDYALFFDHAAHDPAEQHSTLHAIVLCSLATLMVFAALAASTIPVLRAIGIPVAIGVVSNFVLAALLTAPPSSKSIAA